jgi:UDP:flavonoid glycosyltransferase YjiC (YdhE family)
VLALFPRFLAKPQPDWPSQVVQTGFPFFSQPSRPETTEKLDSFLASGEPPIVFTLGSSAVHIAHDFYQSAADAARLLGRRAILLLGKNPSPATLPNRVLAIDYAPLESVLPRAAAVIHHGGIGTCAEALRVGLPSLIVPFDYDQPDNAERLRRLGVAKVLRRSHFSAELLVSNLHDLLVDSAMTARAHGLSSRIHPVSDLAESLNAIERVDGSHETTEPRGYHRRTAPEAAQGMPAAVLGKRDPEVDR